MMPELPEVETVRRGLEKHVAGRRIRLVEGAGGRLVRKNPGGVEQLRSALKEALIVSVERRGKFMWLNLDGPAEAALVIHLGMSGQVLTASMPPGELGRHEHVRLSLDNDEYVRFIDTRMFGHLTLSEMVVDPKGRLVPENASHISPDLLELVDPSDVSELSSRMSRSRRAIKTMLLDQALVSGIGNIYADEGLIRSNLHGSLKGSELPPTTISGVLERTREVLRDAVEAGGTSFDTLYVDAEGNPGYFERELRVYGREGKACLQCGQQIQRVTLNGRSHFFCPACQKQAH